MKIREITSYSSDSKTVVDDFIKILGDKNVTISEPMLRELISSDNSHLFFAFDKSENCMGMLTIGIYISPLGKKAWIEDVVVSEIYRGQGIGKHLMAYAIQFAKKKQVGLLTLTSKPARISANKLYVKMGFERKETNIYKMTF